MVQQADSLTNIDIPEEVKIVKCRCGHESCRTYGLNVGMFYQGSGWDRATAQFIADAINERVRNKHADAD